MHHVYIDASSAILLYKTGLFLSCTQSFLLVMEHTVYEEVRVSGYPGAQFFKSAINQGIVQLDHIRAGFPDNVDLPANLDMGERQTIRLYFQNVHSPVRSFIIMDDAKGARFCLNSNIPFINALLVPKILWFAGLLNKNDYLDKTALVIEKGHYSRTVIEKAKALSSSDLATFIPDET